jgi:phosphoenolpyruvate carboxykinase (ATP)
MKKHQVNVWLVNTGWTGGPYGTGKRIDIRYTRAMVKAALNGELERVDYIVHPVFKLKMPVECPGVPVELLNPRNTWKDKSAYDEQAMKLAKAFIGNFKKFHDVPEHIRKIAEDLLN